MVRGRLTFKQQDVTRAVKAVTAAGATVSQVEITKDGKIVVIVGARDGAKTGADEWRNI